MSFISNCVVGSNNVFGSITMGNGEIFVNGVNINNQKDRKCLVKLSLEYVTEDEQEEKHGSTSKKRKKSEEEEKDNKEEHVFRYTAPPRSFHIEIKGDVEHVDSSNAAVTVNGNVGEGISTTNGTISVTGEVKGSVTTTNGTIKVGGDVHGSAKTTNGNVYANNVKKKDRSKTRKVTVSNGVAIQQIGKGNSVNFF